MVTGPNGAHQAKILLVDDNQDFLRVMDMTLRSLGHEVLTASDPETGLEIAVAEKPDIILLDLYMPGMDGYELGRLLSVKEETCDIPYVIVSSAGGDQFRRKGVEWGAEAFVSKESLSSPEGMVESGPTAVVKKEEINVEHLEQPILEILTRTNAH
jgi:twitching motility two-component system response regulator PilH